MTAAAGSLATVPALLAAVDALPPVARQVARVHVEGAMSGDARRCRAALGLLALELAPAAADGRLEDVAAVVDLDSGATTFELVEDAPPVARRQLGRANGSAPAATTGSDLSVRSAPTRPMPALSS